MPHARGFRLFAALVEAFLGEGPDVLPDLLVEALEARVRRDVDALEAVVEMACRVDDGQIGLAGIDDEDDLDRSLHPAGEIDCVLECRQ